MASKSKSLTEAELTKMPKSEYMNPAQLKFFKERLIELQKELRAAADSLQQASEQLRGKRRSHHTGRKLFEAFALTLDLPEDYFLKLLNKAPSQLRLA